MNNLWILQSESKICNRSTRSRVLCTALMVCIMMVGVSIYLTSCNPLSLIEKIDSGLTPSIKIPEGHG